jgi:malonyl-CoA O-methyltransferase
MTSVSPIRFCRAAATYEQHARLHRQIAEELLEFPAPPITPTRILDAGCGTGVLTRLLANRFPEAAITALDRSAAMLHIGMQTLPPAPLLSWTVDDLNQHHAPVPYNLITSSASLQWMPTLALTCQHLSRQLVTGGTCWISAMVSGTLHELHTLRNQIAPRKKPVRSLPAHDQFVALLSSSPWQLQATACRHYTVEFADARTLLRTLHEQGVTGGTLSRGSKLLNRTELTRLLAEYSENYATPSGGVYATYTVGFYCARKEQEWKQQDILLPAPTQALAKR